MSGGGGLFHSIPTGTPRQRSAAEEEDDTSEDLYWAAIENLYNPFSVVANPSARKGYKGTGIASLGVRDAVLALVGDNRASLGRLEKLKSRTNDMRKKGSKKGKREQRQPMVQTMTAARGGLVRPSFPDRLNRIMGYR